MPRLSVIIASVNGLKCIAETLEALERQPERPDAEVIVVDRCGGDTAEAVHRHFPDVRLIPVPSNTGIPAMRAAGVRASTGDIITITEDHCIAPPDWFAQILRAHETSGHAAIGGTVENGAVDSLVDWSVFFCEYTHCMGPIPAGVVDGIPGNNASYQRWALNKCRDVLEAGVWENFLHDALRARGVPLFSVPSIVLYHKKSFGVLEFLGQRYHYGRSFAAMRTARAPWRTRLFYTLASPALPALLLPRMVGRALSKKRFLKEFTLSLPLLALYTVSWAAGEFCGYLLGPGRSLEKVE